MTRIELHQLSGLRPVDYAVLARLAGAPWLWLPKTELIRGIYVTWSHLGKTLVGLERRGYVERVQAVTSGEVRVKLTDPGWEIWRTLRDLDRA
ncbi:hypothetical protein [Kibdelosporangium phytohabitans]|uniref:hypothetical protein n=1 Tax=Kibdelosporangium phytohabitans TaxID=860235 RepID=UPI0012F79B6B|nr:hypothetical protein [Kibdelosporangium phytohabitans]MBE1462514.1 DNA-binding MarR family transcriptional regulator [Kibdelosporangium phytohabitans]